MKGWRLTIALGIGLLALTALELAVWGTAEEGIRVVVRSTARSSILLFALAFTASSLRALWHHPASAWLLANRRYIGVSYAVSHVFHAAARVALYPASPEFATSLNPVTLVGGGIAYAFTLAMAATSNDAAVAALGRRRCRRLHWIGGWYIWLIFAQSYLPRAAMSIAYLPAGLLVIAILGLRIVRARKTKAAASSSPAPQPPSATTATS